MASLNGAKRMIRLTCAIAPALLCLAVPSGEAQTASIEFKGTISNEAPQVVRVWPYTIVSFTSEAILPVGDVCIADCETMTIKRQGAAAPFQVVFVKGERAAIVATGDGTAHYTVCAGGRTSCMRYTVLRAR
jgi:hypothetical protein